MIGHHICHGGYDYRKDGSLNRFKFAAGAWRRAVDWFDWMLPEAWNVEHNHLHHYQLGELGDPDLVETNMASIRDLAAPLFVKRIVVFVMACTWKWLYYAPNTYKQLIYHRETRNGKSSIDPVAPWLLQQYMMPEGWKYAGEFFGKVLLPYALYKFVVYPLPFLLIGGWAAFTNAVLCVVLSDVFANLYSFLIIVSNHCGDDLYRFDTKCAPYSGAFYLRAVVSSANFTAGTDVVDFAHGWLNYQIEHHCFPSLSMLSYQRAMPRVKAICEKHGVPYVQQNVVKRLWKTVDIMIGRTSMRRWPKGF
jgi:fatty acid desaturase